MSTSASIRRVRADEVAAERSLRLRALRSDPIAFGSSYAEEAKFPEEKWRERTVAGATSGTQSTWVAEVAGVGLIGSVTIIRTERGFGVFGMWLDPDHRGSGLGRQMLVNAIRWAEEQDPTPSFWLDVNPKQHAAVRTYEGLGFRRTGKTRPLGHTAGETVEEMVRP